MTPSATTSTTSERLKVAVVGCGNIGPNHARAYAATGKTDLVGVADIVFDKAVAFAETFGSTPNATAPAGCT